MGRLASRLSVLGMVLLASAAVSGGTEARVGTPSPPVAAVQDRAPDRGPIDDARAERPERSTVELRSYNLKAGTRAEFHRLVVEEAVPLLERWNVDVVGYGPSSHDEDTYFLVRAYESPEARRQSDESFYGSEAWRQGPRAAILALIDSYATIVLELDDATIAGLRAAAKSARQAER